MKDMFAVLDKTSELIEDIKQSQIYAEYKAALHELQKDPDLLGKADAFRKTQFQATNCQDRQMGFQEASNMEEAYEKIAEYPVIERFLKAELALCRMLQRIQTNIVEAMDFR